MAQYGRAEEEEEDGADTDEVRGGVGVVGGWISCLRRRRVVLRVEQEPNY